jgi:hypothetical protein
MQYSLEKYNGLKTRFNCPNCGGKQSFARYIDIDTKEYLADNVGRCNKIDKCGYHKKPPLLTKCFFVPFQYHYDYSPKSIKITNSNIDYYLPKSQVFEILENGCYLSEWYLLQSEATKTPVYSYTDIKVFDKENGCSTQTFKAKETPIQKPLFSIPIEQLNASLNQYNNNNFALILTKLFGNSEAVKLLDLYKVGTSKKWNGANIFWQIDANEIVRTGKIMLYNIETYKRVKTPYDHISWVHTKIKTDTQELKQCFFGEHLINQFPLKPIAIVESEKTAIICSYYLPDYNWLSAGNINGLNKDKFKVLSGRKVILFPDLKKGFEIWQQKANEFKNIAEVSISNYLETIATPEQKEQGLDLADYLLNKINSNVDNVDNAPKNKTLFFYTETQKAEVTPNPNIQIKRFNYQLERWAQSITDLETFFSSIELPNEPIKINKHSTITNVPLFIESHLQIVKANNGINTFLPYLNRLRELKNYLTIN